MPDGGEVVPGYFAGGKGTAQEPYIINSPIHLYNLAWLQDMGRFNDTYDENGDLVQYHFVVSQDLDMTGYTLPPIGTRDFPFIGTFTSADPNEPATITNLTVSNVIDNGEISIRPASVADLSGAEIVGMFGIIGQYEGIPEDARYDTVVPSVSYFNLINPTVRTQTERSLAGLIAGYVNGKLHEVGVFGGQLVSGENNTSGLTNNNISIYTLIGDRDPDVNWGGVNAPGDDGGGPLKVDGNDSETLAAAEDDSVVVMVPDSEKRAYLVGASVNGGKFNGQSIGTIYFYKNEVTAGNQSVGGNSSAYYQLSSSGQYNQTTITNSINPNFLYNSDLANRLDRGGIKGITTGTTAPNYNNLVSLDPQNDSFKVPANGIWFKPENAGQCVISFGVTDKSGGNKAVKYKSVYRYTRKEVTDAQGNTTMEIDPASWTETKLEFANSNFGNNAVVIYHFIISEQDIKDGAEFVIGSTTGAGSDTVMFYFLALAGVADNGGTVTSTSKEIFEVNFIDKVEYEGSILGADRKVTTFVLALLDTGSEEYAIFSRASMSEHAVGTSSDQQILEVTKREHVGIPPDNAG